MNKLDQPKFEEMGDKIDNTIIRVERQAAIESDYSVLNDSDKSFEEQNKIARRQLFVSLFRLTTKDKIFC